MNCSVSNTTKNLIYVATLLFDFCMKTKIYQSLLRSFFGESFVNQSGTSQVQTKNINESVARRVDFGWNLFLTKPCHFNGVRPLMI